MKVLDATLLLYAYDGTSVFHAEAKDWLESLFSSGELVGIPWQTVGAFLRLIASPKLPRRRLTSLEAMDRDFGRFDGLRWDNPLAE